MPPPQQVKIAILRDIRHSASRELSFEGPTRFHCRQTAPHVVIVSYNELLCTYTYNSGSTKPEIVCFLVRRVGLYTVYWSRIGSVSSERTSRLPACLSSIRCQLGFHGCHYFVPQSLPTQILAVDYISLHVQQSDKKNCIKWYTCFRWSQCQQPLVDSVISVWS